MKCKNCGATTNAEKCPYCGNNNADKKEINIQNNYVTYVTPPQAPHSPTSEPLLDSPPPQRYRKAALMIFGVFFISLIGVLLWVFIFK